MVLVFVDFSNHGGYWLSKVRGSKVTDEYVSRLRQDMADHHFIAQRSDEREPLSAVSSIKEFRKHVDSAPAALLVNLSNALREDIKDGIAAFVDSLSITKVYIHRSDCDVFCKEVIVSALARGGHKP